MLGVDNHFFKFVLVSRIFLRGTRTPKVNVLTYYFANFLPKNCMKMKEFGPWEGGASLAPPWREK